MTRLLSSAKSSFSQCHEVFGAKCSPGAQLTALGQHILTPTCCSLQCNRGGQRPLREAITQSPISVGFRLFHSPLCASLCPGQTLWGAHSAAQWTPRGPAHGSTGDSSAAVLEGFLPLYRQQAEKEIAGEWPLQGQFSKFWWEAGARKQNWTTDCD